MKEIKKNQKTNLNPNPKSHHKVENIEPLTTLLNQIAPNEYEIRVLKQDEVKIQTVNEASYSALTKALLEKKTDFHTYKIKSERHFNVVLRGMHYSTPTEEIEQQINSQGHEVVNISNILDKRTKKPLSLFWVNLKTNQKNKEIYNIKSMLHTKISFEPPKPKRVIPQCTNCQRYGHTKKFCNHSPRCVKCTGNHHTKDCRRTERSNDVKCVLCENNHPANYKGCQVYKELQDKVYPRLRGRELPNSGSHAPIPLQNQSIPNVPSVPNHQTYADVANNINPPIPNSNTPAENSDMSELKSMMKALMQQMSTILNLLTVFINRTPQ